ncbi:MAG: Ycf66 family protein [Oculatellaceae cyanobacterium Prado106]|jgi:hypothetical protein|nr:Ycf66 family protein [Oculatellaceae cyanobacterium Prado106]
MLPYFLALIVSLASLMLYLAAFLFPEIHRKFDFVWSGLGLFYGLVLWVCAGRITGGLLLGQLASVALLGGFSWQLLQLRWEQLPLEQRPVLSDAQTSWVEVLRDRIAQLQANLRQREWRSASLTRFNVLAENLIQVGINAIDWVAVLLETTTRSWKTPHPPAQPPLSPPAAKPFPTAITPPVEDSEARLD